jgi:presenilin-like A22 family membrane protease
LYILGNELINVAKSKPLITQTESPFLMKHDLKVTFYLFVIFLVAQAVGLFILSQTIESVSKTETGTIIIKYEELPTGRPEFNNVAEAIGYIVIMIIFGTLILLGLIKFRLFRLWKLWFFLAVSTSISFAFYVFIPFIPSLIIGLFLAYMKLFRPNIFIHNLTEVFMYAGITILIVPTLQSLGPDPIITVIGAAVLLILISIYDAIAVWKLKHMITLATAQADQKMFAGLLIPYKKSEEESEVKQINTVKSAKKTQIKMEIPKGINQGEVKSAILGGGDIAFPLFFSGSVMTWLIQIGMQRELALFEAMIVSLFAGIALLVLLIKGEKNKFYPAMPFISAGCFIGYGIVRLIMLF